MPEAGSRPTNPHAAAVRPCLLLALGTTVQHGYGLKSRLREFGMEGIELNHIYSGLRSLEGAGLVASTVEPTEIGPARRVYRLTSRGLHVRQVWLQAFERASCDGPAIFSRPNSE